MYNVLTDFHHASLLNSLIMLFEDRLGGKLYRPIGVEWFEKGFWKIYDHPATVQQYLGINGATPDGTPPLNETSTSSGSVYHCKDIDSGKTNKAITLEGFLSQPFDIVIASIPQHIEPFKRLCEVHPNHPRLIYQIGNTWNVEPDAVKNVMASALVPNVPEGINFVSYHQEFDLDVFHPGYPAEETETVHSLGLPPEHNIFSFVNVFSGQEHLAEDWKLFLTVEDGMPAWNFKSYGGQCRDGAIGGSQALADEMRKARFIWHTKNAGDGYGHIVHNAAAVGRPLIVKKSYYVGKLAEALMVDGQTCINIDGLTPSEIIEKVTFYNEPERYRILCGNTYNNFKRVVNFDLEELNIKKFLSQLL